MQYVSKTSSQIADQVRNKGYIELSDVPEFLLKRCRHIEKIIGSINSARADMVESAVKKDKTELFALDYEAIAGLLRDSAENDGEYTLDSALQNKVSKILRSLGIRSMAYGAWGVRRHTLLASGVELGSIAVSSEEIRSALEKGTGLSLGTPEFNFSGEFVSMTLESRPLFSLQWEHSCYCAEGEEISGDRCSCFNGVGDYSYACICDGMGSGAGASAVSEICSMFFEKMLGAGNSIPVTLKLLSNFLRARSEEYHCTADIFRLDTLSGKGCFIKCGACASYVIRNTNIFKIDARSMPLGLTKEINAEKIEIPLLEGDTVVMVSDGVAPDLESALWLPSLLTECAGLPLKELTRLIAGRAKAEKGSFFADLFRRRH